MENLTLIIPAKNESISLPKVLEEIKDYKCKVIVILESSDTETINSIKNYNCKIVYQLGKGKTGSTTTSRKGSENSGGGAQYGGADGTVAALARYQFQDIWPTNISAIDLSMDNGDQIEEFTVEFCVQSYSRLNSDG